MNKSAALYHYAIVRHPADALKLLCYGGTGDSTQPLVLFASGGNGVALQHGYLIPAEYSGILGLLQFDPSSTIVSLQIEDRRMQVVFPPMSVDHTSGQGAILDLLRPVLAQFDRIDVILELGRLRTDLPPMEAGDSVRVFWEIRDHLTPGDLEHLSYLTERVEHEGPKFAGFQSYARRSGGGELSAARRDLLRGLFPPEVCPSMIEMNGVAA